MTPFSGITSRWDKWKYSGMPFLFPSEPLSDQPSVLCWVTWTQKLNCAPILDEETEAQSRLPKSTASWEQVWNENRFPDCPRQSLWYPLTSTVCLVLLHTFLSRGHSASPSHLCLHPITTCFWKNSASDPSLPVMLSPSAADIFPAFSL